MDIRTFFTKKRRVEEGIHHDEPHCSKPTPSSMETSLAKQVGRNRINYGIPSDIARIGEPIKQIILNIYPKENNRAFVADWFKRYKWLQYSVERDAAFCYPCQQFLPHGSKQSSYTSTGFRNWKNASDTRTGFPKHEKSIPHTQAMAMWQDKLRRISTGSSVETLINHEVLEKNRYYMKSIVEVIQFLVVNELALRGNYVLEEKKEQGLFQNLFEYTCMKDPNLKEAFSHIPQNATYHSPEIQNQIIQAMVQVVQNSIVKDIKESDVNWFTLMEDGTRDKNNRENIAIAIRYVKDGIVNESLLTVTTTEHLDAATFTELTLNTLTKNGIDLSRMLSQCYDGASVMSGKVSGVATRIENQLGRKIPYVHCYNHRLHLIVIRTISEMTFIRLFFDQCIMLHEFFHHGKIAAMYGGKIIGRLLEQRWSGHLAVTKVVNDNYSEILLTLDKMKNDRFNGDDVAKSVGIKKIMLNLEFRMAMVVAKKILSMLQPADASLQARSAGLKDALIIINCVQNEITKLRTDEMYHQILEEAKSMTSIDSENRTHTQKRQVRRSNRMDDYLMFDSSCSSTKQNEEDQPFKSEYFETLDILVAELQRRFSDNDDLLNSVASLDELDVNKMEPLKNLGITIPSNEEATVVKAYLSRREDKTEDIVQVLYRQREAFKDTYELFASVATIGCSTAVCESTFSTLTAINRPQRLSMSHERMAGMVFLAFEKRRTQSVDLNEVLRIFNNMTNRRIQLF
ncbi:zinc finger MYM-type protein 1-like [Harmonia axyridis]|uniref:zinc finger MYM-type protein 1-like n=3 Tax=Harmonia axyridis TaxID=115357 RepID=UPI001E278E51|nr:zinc finger MYM-type protein 1-like [Harmonia axyridis]XP_045460411.1 zinc finger MYM-type protein 1-like [Harmonia axyridis]XP_045460637.1 zinc finger MYM-type protein 1-like [Harmonia axyridis]XP_045461265.1 zinc finger MYM-type protein 1-like [Harmonia axyridis]XP_045461514.1 zinc finger MYM-type protein 1-like [Harmonia axyridis]XP_045462044.1 zinc finger MYM-type protein 1-like [Harmonia axyridis]XP_045462202.1 zinc finger MYM-type protein 1-like [Harmonia axyridis]XP_045462203.1 zin